MVMLLNASVLFISLLQIILSHTVLKTRWSPWQWMHFIKSVVQVCSSVTNCPHDKHISGVLHLFLVWPYFPQLLEVLTVSMHGSTCLLNNPNNLILSGMVEP